MELSNIVWRNIKYLFFLLILGVISVANGFKSQEELKYIKNLKKELEDVKYDALTKKSQLLEKSRQSHIEDYIESQQGRLEIASSSPFVIK